MKRFWLACAFALACVGGSQAGGWIKGQSYGFGKLQDKALGCFSGIHQHGPLYNYTPMQGDYTWMSFHWHKLNHYTPAQALYYPGPGCGNGGCGTGCGNNCGIGNLFGGLFSGLLGGCNNGICSGGHSWSGFSGWFGGCNSCHSTGIFGGWGHKGGSSCGTGGCGTSGGCTSGCGGSGVVQSSYVGTIYSPILAPAWK